MVALYNNPTETRIAHLLKDEQGVIHITMKNCGLVDKYDIIDLNLVLRNMGAGQPSLKLVDARAIWSMTEEAKKKAEVQDSVKNTKARAIVVSSIVGSSMMNFFRLFSKKEYPQRVFNEIEPAYQWLLTFKTYDPATLSL